MRLVLDEHENEHRVIRSSETRAPTVPRERVPQHAHAREHQGGRWLWAPQPFQLQDNNPMFCLKLAFHSASSLQNTHEDVLRCLTRPLAQYEQFWSNRKVTIRGCQFDFDTQFAPKTKKRSSRSTYVPPVMSPASPRMFTVINMYSRRIIAGLDGQQYEWKCHDHSTWKVCFGFCECHASY